ncbi:phosphatidylserine synthase [Candidatus Riesia sp. GBBU]|nr:phosphatidylserine synthase [Candidatus Riesia sp. GBBU]
MKKFTGNYHSFLKKLKKLPQSISGISTIYKTKCFRKILLEKIANSKKYIYIVALYFEMDGAGKDIIKALYKSKRITPKLDIKIIVDLNRAKRNRVGERSKSTNADLYRQISVENPLVEIPIYGVPISISETFGVFHLKGFIFDNFVVYSGANINNSYLRQKCQYRYDRYHLIKNRQLAITMKSFIDNYFISSKVVQRLDKSRISKKNFMLNISIQKLRKKLRNCCYTFTRFASNDELSVTPLIGLGKKNFLNKTILNLMYSTEKIMVICTPYFNFPNFLMKIIEKLLFEGKKIEIITADKTANDFFSFKKKFNYIHIIPYLYENNLRLFVKRLQYFIDTQDLKIRVWKNGINSCHLKGMWIDENWQLITGNNLNIRSWRLDLENAILIHDPNKILKHQKKTELKHIKKYTKIIKNFKEIDDIKSYPDKIRIILRKLMVTKIDKLLNNIL